MSNNTRNSGDRQERSKNKLISAKVKGGEESYANACSLSKPSKFSVIAEFKAKIFRDSSFEDLQSVEYQLPFSAKAMVDGSKETIEMFAIVNLCISKKDPIQPAFDSSFKFKVKPSALELQKYNRWINYCRKDLELIISKPFIESLSALWIMYLAEEL